MELFDLADFCNPSNTLASGELGAKCKRSEKYDIIYENGMKMKMKILRKKSEMI